MASKRILIIVNNLGVGGAERLVVDDINEMLQRGIEVTLLTLKTNPVENLSGDCKLTPSKRHTILFNNFFDYSAWRSLLQIIRTIRPDMVFTHLWYANTLGRIAAFWARTSVISFEHNIYDSVKTSKMFFVDRLLQYFCLRIIAVSSAVKDSLVSHGIKSDKVDVVVNGIDQSPYQQVEKNKNNPAIFSFISIGRLIPQKGMDILIRAFTALPDSAVLQIVGQGINREALQNLAESLGVSKRVFFLGVRHDVPKLLAESDCFVLASRYEGLGIVLIEAMAARLPIIASDFLAVHDILKNNVEGLIVPREKAGELGAAMLHMMNDKELRDRLSACAEMKAKEYTIQNHVQKLLDYVR